MNRQAFYHLNYGLYIISARKDDKLNGQIANTVFQVTSEPQTIAVSISKENLTHDYIKSGGHFTVSILSEAAPMTFIGLFGFKSGKNVNKFEKGVNFKKGVTGTPVVLDYSVAYMEAELIKEMDCGTHTIFLGRVVDCDLIDSHAKPMTYAYYHEVKKGKAPKTAPTFMADVPLPKTQKAASYTCTVCGYIYNPAQGDADAGVKPGTPFEELPEDWTCPICGVEKAKFEKSK